MDRIRSRSWVFVMFTLVAFVSACLVAPQGVMADKPGDGTKPLDGGQGSTIGDDGQSGGGGVPEGGTDIDPISDTCTPDAACWVDDTNCEALGMVDCGAPCGRKGFLCAPTKDCCPDNPQCGGADCK